MKAEERPAAVTRALVDVERGQRSLARRRLRIAQFEGDLIRARTREGMAVAKAKGRLRGKQPKLSPKQEGLLVELWRDGKHTTLDLAELSKVGRSTVYRAIQRAGPVAAGPAAASTTRK